MLRRWVEPATRDPDRFDAYVESPQPYRPRFIPSGLAHETGFDTLLRPVSFEPGVPFPKRLFDAYAAEVKRVDENGYDMMSAPEGDPDASGNGFPDNSRLLLTTALCRRFDVTRHINDGYLAPRFAPSQRARDLSGNAVSVSPPVSASQGRDGDDR